MSAPDETQTVDSTEGIEPRARVGVELRRGSALDHFIVLDELGRGGMGVVVCAYDPDVDRRVAIKLLHHGGASADDEARRRNTLREAKAMGRISHPNVVTVYEVGVFDQHPFIVMEYIDGVSLRAWLDERDRDREEILAAFRQAGLGLAAAHDAGLVHRDFKPENVLVDRDGRAAVADFGIAGLDAGDATGRTAGTPAYMSPEQHTADPTDARSDQFSFCVALYEALHGHRPFRGDTAEQIAERVESGAVEPPSRGLPVHLRQALDRGLSTDPADRFESMHSLLAALETPHDRNAWLLLGAAGAAIIAAAVVVALVTTRGSAPDPCARTADKVATVWNPDVEARMLRAFERAGRDDANDAHARVATAVRDYTARWSEMYTGACRATHIYHEQSPALLDRRSACLNERLAAVAGLADVLTGELTNDQIDNAYSAARALPPLDECADIERLEAAVPPPTDPDVRRAADEQHEILVRAEALANTGDYTNSLPDIVKVAGEAETLGYAPLLADAQYLHGFVLWKLGEADQSVRELERAVVSAGHAADDELAAWALGDMMVAIGLGQGDVDRALGMVPIMRAMVARAGDPPLLRALVHKRHSTLLFRKSDYVEAEAEVRAALAIYAGDAEFDLETAYARRDLGLMLMRQREPADAAVELEAALAELERLMGADDPETIVLRDGLGGVYEQLDRLDDALAQHQRNLEVREKVFGADHWKLSTSLNNIATVYLRMNDFERAQDGFRRAIELRKNSGNGPDTSLAVTYGNLALAHRQQGEYDEAIEYDREALRLHEQVTGPDHLQTANAHDELAQVLSYAGRHDEALKEAAIGLSMREAKLGPTHKEVGSSLITLGAAHRRAGRCDLAMGELERALAIYDGDSADTSYFGAVALDQIARCQNTLGRYADAIASAERAIDYFDGTAFVARLHAARFELAQALWEARPDQRERAVQLARAALEFAEPTKLHTQLVARIRAWLDSRS